MTTMFQAYAEGCRITADSPRAAAEALFKEYPKRRKCSIVEGTVDGSFFTVAYGPYSKGQWPQSFRDVTKSHIASLPGKPAATHAVT